MKSFYHLTQFVFITFLFVMFKLIGFKYSSNIGFFLGKTLGPIFRSKSLIIKNLKKANIKGDFEKIASNVLGNYGRIFSEYVHLRNFKNDKLSKYISIEGKEYLDQIKKNKKKVIFVSGHFNNFELMALQIEKAGINCAAIYRPLNNPYLNKVMEKIRKRDICKKQIKKGLTGTRELVRLIKEGTSIALMVDQRVREGEKVTFFNHLATSTTIPAQFIKKYECDLVPIYIERKNKFHFKMYVSKPITIGKNKSSFEITKFINQILEKMILKNIDQWIWTHDRWKN
ncbi:lysophospholipid acyltransferase family protein [Candidatus Pelagibacter sp. HIMB1495]|uniref:lysophospholipid acyltransferase family protein n=1 Tax=unclassified Candidatus Pelagibacter TaxID=2647897 RepID=UPI003F871C57